jgi:hypothetical protein
MKCLDAGLVFISLDDGGSVFSMLNRNLPMYMNCPYCQLSKNKKDPPEVKFAGTVSQLQRIFLVHNFASLFIHFPDFYVVSVVLNSIYPEGQGRQPPAVTAQPPTGQPPATSCLPPQPPAAFTLEG